MVVGSWCCVFNHYELSIFIMVIVVWSRPDRPADIAKLISTFAGHVIAPLVLFDDELALDTLTIMQVTLEKLHLVSVTFTFVPSQQAFPTKL